MSEKNEREENYVLNCRHCEAKNRISIEQAVRETETATCGGCRKKLFMIDPEEYFTGIDPFSYEHPMDRAALEALKKVPGTGTFLKWLIKEGWERVFRLSCMHNFVRITEKQLPEYYKIYMKAVKVLDLDYVPDLYFYQDPVPNAFTYGVDDAIVCVSSGALDLLSEQELLFVMGHELAHVQMGHVLYRTAAYILLNLGGMLGSMIGIGGALLTPIILAFMHWQRCSELSADRGGLLCVRYFATSVDTQMKLAGGSMKIAEKMDPDQFLAQAEDAGGMVKESIINMLIMAQMGVHATHPFIVWRAGALKDWAYKGDYLDILSGNYKRRNKGGSAPAEFDEKEFKKEDNEEDFFDQLRNMFTFSS